MSTTGILILQKYLHCLFKEGLSKLKYVTHNLIYPFHFISYNVENPNNKGILIILNRTKLFIIFTYHCLTTKIQR